MFRRLPTKLPPDITFPTTLEELGYLVTEKDQIRQIPNPDRKYQYKISRNDRVNDVYKEAMNTCNRKIVLQRLLDLGLQQICLPLGATQDQKHVPILVSKDIAVKQHVVVIFTERHIDLGILSYRILGDEGINIGSIVNFVKNILEGPVPPAGRPGLIITNPSQLIWYRGGGRPVTDREWMCLPRESAVHSAMRIDEVANRVEGNRNFEEHVQYVFEHVLSASASLSTTSPDETITNQKKSAASRTTALCNPNAKISVIGLEFPGSTALQYLVNHWSGWRHRISCVALCNPQHSLKELLSERQKQRQKSAPTPAAPNPDAATSLTTASSTHDTTANHEAQQEKEAKQEQTQQEEITTFIATRTRTYALSRQPVETILSARQTNPLGCNVYSSGEALYEESVFPRCWPSIVDWIDLCRFSESYVEPLFDIRDCRDDDGDGEGVGVDGQDGQGNGEDERRRRTTTKWPRTEEEVEAARFHGVLEV